MTVLDNIPFVLDISSLLDRLHIEPGSGDARDFKALVLAVRTLARPKALYREAFITARDGDTVTIDGVTFRSRTLHANLAAAQRVFPFIATCGIEADAIPLAPGDVLQQFWLDTIKAVLLGASTTHLLDHLERRHQLGKSSSMSPGSGDADTWPIEQQKELFALLGDVKQHIGVRLTDSFLMIPNKTVSGVRFPTEIDFRSCQVCHRTSCPSRSAPFDKTLWEMLQHD